MGAAERLAADAAYASSPEYADLCRTEDRFFTRDRSLTCGVLTSMILCRRGLSSAAEAWGLSLEGAAPDVSRQAVQKARAKMDPEAIRALMGAHASAFYRDEGVPELLGMVPVAIDGSVAELPTCARTLADWGAATGRAGGHERACLGISCAYDPVGRQVLSVEALPPFFDERSRVMGHMRAAGSVAGTSSLLAILDRGYPSLALIADLLAGGYGFLMRCEAGFLSREFALCEAAGGDLELDVALTRGRLSHLPAAERDRLAGTVVRVRLALVDIGGDAPERLVTSVPASAAGPDDLRAAYHARWGVETCFSTLKSRLSLESWSGVTREQILQDLYAAAYLANVLEDMCRDAERRASAAGASTSADGAVGVAANRSFAAGVLKRGMLRVARDPLGCLWACLWMVAEMSRHVVPVQPGRSFPRSGLLHGGKRRASCTHKRCF